MVRLPGRVRWGFAALTAFLAIAAVRNAFAPHAGLGPLTNRFAHDAALVIASGLCLYRSARHAEERTPWLLIGLGIAAWTLGEIYYTGVLWTVSDVPFPSPADAGYLLMPPLVLSGLVLLLRARVTNANPTAWADGFTAALAVGAVCAAIVFDSVASTVGGDLTETVTTLAYPLCDLILGTFVIGALAGTGWRPDRTFLLLGAGVLTFWLADSLYLVKTANDTVVSPDWFDAGWWIGLTCIAAAAWQPAPLETDHAPQEGVRLIVMPLLFAVVGLALLVYATFMQINAVAVVLAACALISVMVRLILTFRENLGMLRVSRGEALTDALTGLPNRRALSRRLEAVIPEAHEDRPLVLALFDLDGFKSYNDTFGHPAGDALLVRLGANLEAYLDGRGMAFRMGGDEFCALFHPGDQVAEPIVMGAAAALSEHGEGFSIGCSYGSIFLPLEAQDASEALRIADHRMYAQKNSGRASARQQSIDVLVRTLAERSPGLKAHLQEVADLAETVARRLGLTDDETAQVRHAAELHDVGKVAVPERIVEKPGPLNAEEWSFMRKHTLIGERIIAAAPALAGVARLVRSTHEHWDGRGYPDGLVGEDIPLGARIVAVADAFDAMTVRRPYSEPRKPQEALGELRQCAGAQFDPVVVEVFCACWNAKRVGPPTALGVGS
jgi:diguanylate cyclase (GGDEF)-like protein